MKARFIYRAMKARFRDQRVEVREALAAIAPGDTALDVGANKGSYLLWLSRAVGPGRVVAFEPQPNLAAYLQKAVTALSLRNVTVEPVAVSDRAGEVELYVPGEGDSPGASLSQAVADRGPCRTTRVRAVTLDDYCRSLPRVSLIKIDVEGHELSLFRGAENILQRDKPVLIFECEERHLAGGSVFDVFRFLQERGYQGWFISGNELQPLAQFDPAIHQRQEGPRFWDAKDYCNNFVFKPSR